MNLLKTMLILTFCLSLMACKKAIEEKQKDLLIEAVTKGVWYVELYLEGSTDVTGGFTGYEFKFAENGEVTAFFNGSSKKGTWLGSMTTYTITSDFPGAGDPLQKLNGTWKITDSYLDYVEAEMNTGNGKNVLHLRKKP